VPKDICKTYHEQRAISVGNRGQLASTSRTKEAALIICTKPKASATGIGANQHDGGPRRRTTRYNKPITAREDCIRRKRFGSRGVENSVQGKVAVDPRRPAACLGPSRGVFAQRNARFTISSTGTQERSQILAAKYRLSINGGVFFPPPPPPPRKKKKKKWGKKKIPNRHTVKAHFASSTEPPLGCTPMWTHHPTI